MPNKRGRTQRLVNFPASETFIEEMDRAMVAAGYSNRSEFIRDAIGEKLQGLGMPLSPGADLAPPRIGKRTVQRFEDSIAQDPKANSDEKADRRTAQQIVNQSLNKDIADVTRRGRKGAAARPGGGSAGQGPVSRGSADRVVRDATGTSGRISSPQERTPKVRE